ncbi:hypothetical protein JNB11_00665 [Kocuria palustris]|nr:hypothetical protein [Kocuria palustris]
MSTCPATPLSSHSSLGLTVALAKQLVTFLQELEKQHQMDRQAAQGLPRPLAVSQSAGFDADKAGYDHGDVYPHLVASDTLVKFDPENDSVITQATLRALIVQLTLPDVIDYPLICDFFLTYRLFVTGDRVMQMLTARLVWALEACRSLLEEKHHLGKLVVVRTFVALRHWILNYFADDFVPHPSLGDALVTTLNHITGLGLVQQGDGSEAQVLVELKVHWLTMVGQYSTLYTDIEDLVRSGRMLDYELPPTTRLSASKADPTWRRLAMLLLYDQPQQTAPGLLKRLMCRHQLLQTLLPQQLDDYTAKYSLPSPPQSHQPPHSHINIVDLSRPHHNLFHPVDSPKDPRPAALGFATNGRVKLPLAVVSQIIPTTPVRKMEALPLLQALLALAPPPPKFNDDSDLARRLLLKKIVDGMKRTWAALPHLPKMPTSTSEQTITLVRTITSTEPVPVIGNRMDVLAARIVDELELMVEYYNQPPSIASSGPAESVAAPVTKSPFGAALIRDTGNNDPVILLSSPQESPAPLFQQPALINWSEDVPFDLDEHHDLPIKVTIPKLDLYLDFSLVLEDKPPRTLFDLVLTPLNFTQYSNDVIDLGIAPSPAKPGSLGSRKPLNDPLRVLNLLFRRDLVKLYLSYDLALSVLREVVVMEQLGGLRKKHGYANLRMATATTETVESQLLVPRPRLLRLLTLCALTELPFPEGDQNPTDQLNTDALLIFLIAVRSRLASMRCARLYIPSDTLTNSAAIPGISSQVLKQLAAIPDELFAAADPVEYALNKLEGRSPATQATPALKDSIAEDFIAEDHVDLCVGPDDVAQIRQMHQVRIVSLHHSQLMVLVRASGLDLTLPLADAENTEDIMRAINQANTLDVDDSASVHTPEPPLTPHKYHFGTLTPRALVGELPLEEPSIDILMLAKDLPQLPEPQTLAAPFHSPGGDSMASEQFHSTRNTLQSQQSSPDVTVIHHSSKAKVSPAAGPEAESEAQQLPPVPQFNLAEVIEKGTHVSFIHNCPARVLAVHFTAIERDIIQDIDWKDLIEHKWNRDLAPVNLWLEIIANEEYYTTNQGVNLVIARFNLMVNWVILEVLLTKSQSERVGVILRMIHVAHHCLVLQNYLTLMQVVLALTLEKLHRLKDTWMHLHPGDILMLKNLEELTLPLKNFLNLRIAINTTTPLKGCIPFVGLYLLDLIFNAERPTFIKAATDDGDKLINFSKFRTLVHIVRLLSQCIEWLSNYHLEMVPEVLLRCLYIKSLDEDEMNYCVDHIDDP